MIFLETIRTSDFAFHLDTSMIVLHQIRDCLFSQFANFKMDARTSDKLLPFKSETIHTNSSYSKV